MLSCKWPQRHFLSTTTPQIQGLSASWAQWSQSINSAPSTCPGVLCRPSLAHTKNYFPQKHIIKSAEQNALTRITITNKSTRNRERSVINIIATVITLLVLSLTIFIYSRIKIFFGKGEHDDGSFGTWRIVAILILSLPITWDAVPTWALYCYYSWTQAGITVFKPFEQWEKENPGITETLEPYGISYIDRRMTMISLPGGTSRMMLNPRFSYDERVTNVAWSVRLVTHEIIDTKTDQVLVRWVGVHAGNSGGFAEGGEGWWKFWLLLHSSTPAQQKLFEEQKRNYQFLGVSHD